MDKVTNMAEETPNVEAQDPGKQNSPIELSPYAVESTPLEGECVWNGQVYSSGAFICSPSGRLMCNKGSWWPEGSC
jgi:hypothetical protein